MNGLAFCLDRAVVFGAALAFLTATAFAQSNVPLVAHTAAHSVVVRDAWIRGTVDTQTATGGYMEITSREHSRLVSASSTAAGRVELHEMRMEGNTMKMRAVETLALPAGKTVRLSPGGYHLMLLDLKHALRPGVAVPVTLVVEDSDGKRRMIEVTAEVRALGGVTH